MGEQRHDDLYGMKVEDAKAYITGHIATVKIMEKNREELNGELTMWESRVNLARSKGALELAAQAAQEVDALRAKQASLDMEIVDLRNQIETMRRQLPGLAARERSIDPDLLEQELLIATGYLPGDEEKAAVDQKLKALEKDASTDAALEALKMVLKGAL
jgi:phage shock protein A